MWVRLDDAFTDNPKIMALSDGAFRLYVIGLCYSARFLTDGRVPSRLGELRPRPANELVGAGLWAREHGVFIIHDWADYNLPADAVRQRRKASTERQRRWRDERGD